MKLFGFRPRAKSRELNVSNIKNLAFAACTMGLSALAFTQSEAAPAQVTPADAKNHTGETVTVCGKVVDAKTNKYGIAGRGKPVMFDLDQPEPDPMFYFVTFGTKAGGPEEAIAAYKGKSVCVTGKITLASGRPYIMADDRTNIKPKAEK
jgi:hypothetical protein